jgi:hypothetical protein
LLNVLAHPVGLFLGEMVGSDLETPKKNIYRICFNP